MKKNLSAIICALVILGCVICGGFIVSNDVRAEPTPQTSHVHVFPMAPFVYDAGMGKATSKTWESYFLYAPTLSIRSDVLGYPNGYFAIEDATYSVWYGTTEAEAFARADAIYKANKK